MLVKGATGKKNSAGPVLLRILNVFCKKDDQTPFAAAYHKNDANAVRLISRGLTQNEG